MEIITSVNNQLVKESNQLKQKKYREEAHTFLVEGLRAVEEAVAAGKVQRLFFTPTEDDRARELLRLAEAAGASLYQTDGKVMSKLSDTKCPQGMVAVAELPDLNLVDWVPAGAGVPNLESAPAAKKGSTTGAVQPKANAYRPLVVLDRVQDPGNLGTIIRTADAVGAAGLVLLKGTADAFAPKVVRSSMGSLFHLPVISEVSEEELLAWCKKAGYTLAACCLDGAGDLYQTDLTRKLALVLGNEAGGVSETLEAAAGIKVRIPMPGKAESLNVAMAAVVVLFEGLRQSRVK
jgi:TrmH family RNA methyltransferase